MGQGFSVDYELLKSAKKYADSYHSSLITARTKARGLTSITPADFKKKERINNIGDLINSLQGDVKEEVNKMSVTILKLAPANMYLSAPSSADWDSQYYANNDFNDSNSFINQQISKESQFISFEESKRRVDSFKANCVMYYKNFTSGIKRVDEKVQDGIMWAGGKLEYGVYSLGAFWAEGDGAKERFIEKRDERDKAVKEYIARDITYEKDKDFFENTELGRWANENASYQFDSEQYRKNRETVSKVVEITGATLLTIGTGGAAAPVFATGMAVGIGESAEYTYQQGDSSAVDELLILGSGGLKGLSWLANGRLGAGAVQIARDATAIGTDTILSNFSSKYLNRNFIKNTLKESLASKSAIGNYVASGMSTADSVIPYITGQEEFDTGALLKIGGTYLMYLGLNVLEDGARDIIGGYKGVRPSDLDMRQMGQGVMHPEVELVERTSDNSVKNRLLNFFRKGEEKELTYHEWKNQISTSAFQRDINGIRFASNTREGLDSLVNYYGEAFSTANVHGKYFIEVLYSKGLVITDIPSKAGSGSYHWGGTIYFSPNTINNMHVSTFFHEAGHFFDYKTNDREATAFISALREMMQDNPNYGYNTNESINRFLNDYHTQYNRIYNDHYNKNGYLINEIDEYFSNTYKGWKRLGDDQRSKMILSEYKNIIRRATSSDMKSNGYAAVSDIFDALTDGKLYQYGVFGHGEDYYVNDIAKYKEVLANISDLYNTNNLPVLEKYVPKYVVNDLVKSYESVIEVDVLMKGVTDLKMIHEAKYGMDNFDISVFDYLLHKNPQILTRTGNVRSTVVNMSDYSLKKYVMMPSVRNNILTEFGRIVDNNNGRGYFNNCLIAYLNGNNSSIFTRDFNIRAYIEMLDKEDIIAFLNGI